MLIIDLLLRKETLIPKELREKLEEIVCQRRIKLKD